MERDAASLGSRVTALLERCREAGMNVTPQRVAVYRALLEAEDHPSPEVLYRRLRPAMPSLSLATIYKALDALARLGLVREVSVVGERKRFDANVDRHHHLVCSRCKKVSDFYDEALDALAPRRGLGDFVPHSVSVQVMGLCGGCAARGSRRTRFPRGRRSQDAHRR
jgi:Fur family peroxide stress response transcriptional regulator